MNGWLGVWERAQTKRPQKDPYTAGSHHAASQSPARRALHHAAARRDAIVRCLASLDVEKALRNRVTLSTLPSDLIQLILTTVLHQSKLAHCLIAHLAEEETLALCVTRIALRAIDPAASSLSWSVDDDWIAPLHNFHNIEVLELGSCYRISDAPLARCLDAMPNLRILDIDRCKNITDRGVAPIAAGKTPLLQSLRAAAPVFTASCGSCLRLRE